MKHSDIEKLKGQLVLMRVKFQTGEILDVQATIKAAKNSYGNVRVWLEPVAGEGKAWVNFDRCRIISKM